MNYCIFRMEKLKSSSDVCNILKEQHRSEDYESERADKEKSHLNSYSDNFENSFEKFKELLPKKRRKNAVVALNFLVTTSEEFENPEDEKKYYEKAVEFIGKNFGEVVGWAIHRDETSTHMQAVTIPLVDGKLNARELVGGAKNRMRQIQNSFFLEVGEPFGLLRGVEGSKAVHQTVEQKIRKEREELRKEEEKIVELQNYLKQKENELYDREAAVEKKEAALSAAEIELQNKKSLIQDRENEISKNKIELDKQKSELNEWCKLAAPDSKEVLQICNDILAPPTETLPNGATVQKVKKPFNFLGFAKKVKTALTGAWESVKRWSERAFKAEKELDEWKSKSPSQLEKLAWDMKMKNCRSGYEYENRLKIDARKNSKTLKNDNDYSHGR